PQTVAAKLLRTPADGRRPGHAPRPRSDRAAPRRAAGRRRVRPVGDDRSLTLRGGARAESERRLGLRNRVPARNGVSAENGVSAQNSVTAENGVSAQNSVSAARRRVIDSGQEQSPPSAGQPAQSARRGSGETSNRPATTPAASARSDASNSGSRSA